MKIEKLPSGSYRVRKTIKGKTMNLTFKKRPTQREIEEEINRRLGLHNGKLTFKDAATMYISSRTNTISPATIREYKGTLSRLDQRFTSLAIDEITQSDIQFLVNDLSSRLSAKTVSNYHGFVASILVEFRPDMIIRTKLPVRVNKKPYVPTNEEVKALIECAKGTQYEVPILLGCCSMRRGEICALTENDIDFENCIIHITKDMVMDENKNWVIKIPKTLASIRDIKVPSEIIESIKRNGLYKGHPNSISDWMTKAEKRLGIPHFSLHKTRHFFVSVAHNKGESDADIMATGGWATDNVMIKHYRQARSTSEKIVGTVTDGLF